MDMNRFHRFILPVGKGGFDVEIVDDTVIAFDCGSKPQSLVNDKIRALEVLLRYSKHIQKIDYLFLSHFDSDHVNNVKFLAQHFVIGQIVIPYIPRRRRPIVNYVCDNSFVSLLQFSNNKNINVVTYREFQYNGVTAEDGIVIFHSVNSKWMWLVKSLFSDIQWKLLEEKLKEKGISISDVGQAEEEQTVDNIEPNEAEFDAEHWNAELRELAEKFRKRELKYEEGRFNPEEHQSQQEQREYKKLSVNKDIETFKIRFVGSDGRDVDLGEVNKTVGEVFGGKKGAGREKADDNIPSKTKAAYACNEFGLMMLSKKENLHFNRSQLDVFAMPFGHRFRPLRLFCSLNSSCLYLGDLKFDNNAKMSILQLIRINDEALLMMQIPHHCSSHNTKADDIKDIPSELFFWHDRDASRLRDNHSLLKYVQNHFNIFLVDEFYGIAVFSY